MKGRKGITQIRHERLTEMGWIRVLGEAKHGEEVGATLRYDHYQK